MINQWTLLLLSPSKTLANPAWWSQRFIPGSWKRHRRCAKDSPSPSSQSQLSIRCCQPPYLFSPQTQFRFKLARSIRIRVKLDSPPDDTIPAYHLRRTSTAPYHTSYTSIKRASHLLDQSNRINSSQSFLNPCTSRNRAGS
ncbi:hypothetical protein BKA70DRAFT_1274641 [Coprinopsis sp. MPI-PUGE-AT-0042]|nr:hypothetical protein BKA70DRAFT_1274641 [Coprinopsis sp. MPI-PUGE-AT-0042]